MDAMIRRGAHAHSLCLIAAAAVLIVLVVGTAADATTRIVPIGDSITKGMLDTDDGSVHPTYRYWLWNKLRANGYDVDFVGSWSVPDFPGYSFDKANEGHGGYTIGGIVDGVGTGGRLSTWLSGYYPDVALVLIGTNDVLANTNMDTRINNLGRLVDTLRAKNPGIKIFVGKLPPTGDSYRNTNSGLITFNSRLDSWRSGKTTSTSPITVVDLYSGFDGRTDNQAPRYIHPDQTGEQKIADDWYAALVAKGGLSKGTPVTTVPTPTPNPYAITGPRVITSPGTYYFANDILNRNDPVCIEVKSPGVVIDGRGHRLTGTGTQDNNAGIFVNNIPDVTVKNLRVSGWGYGIYYYDQGVSLGRVEGCTIENNLFAGVVLYNKVHGVSVAGNRITGNVGRGVWVADATDNVIYDNWFSNPGDNADVAGTSTGNAFTVVKRAGPNILGGLWIGGNYWAKPDGRGFSQTHGDGNGDGFSDEVFTFSGHTDLLPLTSLAPTPTPGPYRALVVPGTIEAEDYDYGGEGVAYHDTVAGNQGGAYRSDDVDIEGTSGGYTLAYIRDTEWTQYTATVQQAGDYQVELRAAAWNGPRTVRVFLGITEIGTVTVPQTASSSTFVTATTTVSLPAGKQALRLAFTGDGLNLDRAVFTAVVPTATPTPTPTANVTPTANITATPTANVTPSETPTANITPNETATSTPTPTANATETSTPTPTPTANVTPTETVTPTVTPTANGTPTTPAVAPVPDGAGVPTDPNGDGKYDDVNGNSRVDFADAVLYFNQMSWIATNEPVTAFDYNGNGRIDFADVIWLFDHL